MNTPGNKLEFIDFILNFDIVFIIHFFVCDVDFRITFYGDLQFYKQSHRRKT